MYFKSIDINNYGCIEHLSYSFRFNSQGNPIPLILIGENGSGKTLVLSNLADSLIEFKRQSFGNNLLEVKEENYYKVGSKQYIRLNTNTSRVVIKADCLGTEIKYTDIATKNPQLINDDKYVLPEDITNNELFEGDGFSRLINGKIKRKDYSNFINLYFPTDRFYMPLWYNKENYKRIDYKTSTLAGKPKTNMIKLDILSNIREWLMYVYLQTEFQLLNSDQIKDWPQESSPQFFKFPIETPIQKNITQMFKAILNSNDFKHSSINRKSQNISFSSNSFFCNDIDQLSEGQMSLFAIALSIIKEWDIEHDDFNFKEIKGIVIIDEADLGLHIDYAHDAFPRMLRLFPNVQFIITTHSPFMISGLLDHYGDDIDIVSMPDGTKITDVEVFEEMQKARQLFNAGIEKQKSEIKRLQLEITKLHDLNNQVITQTSQLNTASAS